MIKLSLSVLLATLTVIPASSFMTQAFAAARLPTQPTKSTNNLSDHGLIAQLNYNPMYTPDFMMSVTAQRGLELELESRRGGSNSDSSNRPASTPSSRQPKANFKFVSSPQVSAQVRAAIIRKMKQKMPERANEIEQSFDPNTIRNFYSRLQPLGINGNSVDDVVGIHLVSLYEIHTGKAMGKAGIQGVLKQIREIFANSKIASSKTMQSNTNKQIFAEMVTYRTIMLMSSALASRKDNDTARYQQLQVIAKSAANEYGFNFDRLKVTNQGFRPISS
jgi:hypothetical protein